MPRAAVDAASLCAAVTASYTVKTAAQLAGIYRTVYTGSATFEDPFVKASPSTEARLQFLALQRLFSSVTADASEPRVQDPGTGDTVDVCFDVRWRYFWARGGPLTRRLLPEATDVEGTVTLQVDKATHKVLRHTDVWRSPAVAPLPDAARALGARASNALFRLLGWEKELLEADGGLGKHQE